jgi:hypothetical protein
MGTRATVLQVLAAVAALALGAALYIAGRPGGHVYLLASVPQLFSTTSRSLGGIGDFLPSFIHVFAFTLLSAAVLSPRTPGSTAAVVAAWCLTDGLFEFGQHPAVAPLIAALLPSWFDRVPLLENTGPYFLRGTFDPADLAAILAGAAVAFLTIVWSNKQQKEMSCPGRSRAAPPPASPF